MDIYYLADDDGEALTARELSAGPVPGAGFASVEAKDVMACPHLEQLVSSATGVVAESLVPKLRTLWPEPPPPGAEPLFEPGVMITRLPDELRDALAAITVTPAIARAWAAELWSYGEGEAEGVAEALTRLARESRASGKPLYWWSEM